MNLSSAHAYMPTLARESRSIALRNHHFSLFCVLTKVINDNCFPLVVVWVFLSPFDRLLQKNCQTAGSYTGPASNRLQALQSKVRHHLK